LVVWVHQEWAFDYAWLLGCEVVSELARRYPSTIQEHVQQGPLAGLKPDEQNEAWAIRTRFEFLSAAKIVL